MWVTDEPLTPKVAKGLYFCCIGDSGRPNSSTRLAQWAGTRKARGLEPGGPRFDSRPARKGGLVEKQREKSTFGGRRGTILGSSGGHFGIVLGSSGDRFGTIWGSFWGHLGTTLGSFWDHFGTMLGSFWDHVGIILGSFWNCFLKSPPQVRGGR